jgi:hypothetical protein
VAAEPGCERIRARQRVKKTCGSHASGKYEVREKQNTVEYQERGNGARISMRGIHLREMNATAAERVHVGLYFRLLKIF